jgi:NAD(P)-dependent dehydrogenase (short-subunit alcohol dehydrogenase family)
MIMGRLIHSSKLQNNVALISGRGIGIGRAITIHFAKKSADRRSYVS